MFWFGLALPDTVPVPNSLSISSRSTITTGINPNLSRLIRDCRCHIGHNEISIVLDAYVEGRHRSCYPRDQLKLIDE